MGKIVCAFGWCEGVEQEADPIPEGVSCALCCLAQEGLELGEDHLDGVQVWGVGRQVNELGAPGLDQLADALDPRLRGGRLLWADKLSITTISPSDKLGASIFST